MDDNDDVKPIPEAEETIVPFGPDDERGLSVEFINLVGVFERGVDDEEDVDGKPPIILLDNADEEDGDGDRARGSGIVEADDIPPEPETTNVGKDDDDSDDDDDVREEEERATTPADPIDDKD